MIRPLDWEGGDQDRVAVSDVVLSITGGDMPEGTIR